MIQDLIDGVCTALADNFTGNEVYTERMKQGMESPCFFVRCIDQEDGQEVQRYRMSYQFSIQYFPESEEEPDAECHKVAERLFSCLEMIRADGAWIRGADMAGHVEDGVLTFAISYGVFLCRLAEQPAMEQVAVGTEVEG